MSALAPVILVAVLSFAAFATDSVNVPTTEQISIKTQLAAAVEGKEGVANSQCPKPKPGQKYFQTDDQNKWNRVVTDPATKSEFFNLYGKPCQEPTKYGGAIVETICTAENFCNANLGKAKCFQFDLAGKKREAVDCKLYQGQVQEAGLKTPGQACDGCTTGTGAPKTVGDTTDKKDVIAPAAPKQTTQGIDNAYRPAQGPVERGTIPREYSSTARLDEIAKGQPAPEIPKSGTTIANTGNVRLNQEISTGVQGPIPMQGSQMQPGGISGGTNTGINPTRTGSIAQNTFSRTPLGTNPLTRGASPLGGSPLGGSGPTTPSPTRTSGSSFGRLLTNFSIASIFSGVTSALNSVVNSATQPSQTVVQNTTIVNVTPQPAAQQQAPRNTQLPTPQLSQFNPTQFAENLGTTPLTIEEITRGTSVTARDIGKAVDINIPDITDDSPKGQGGSSEQLSELPFYTITPAAISASSSVSAEHITTPAFFTASATSSLDSVESIKSTLAQRIDGLEPIKITNGDFHAEKPVQRTTSVVELFSEINIPDIFTALVEAPADFFRKILGRGVPESRVVTTDRGQDVITPIGSDNSPVFEGGGSTETIPAVTQSDTTVVSANGSNAIARTEARDREAISVRLEKEPEAAFRDASPVHRDESYVPLVKPGNIYPDVVPVPTKKEAPSQAPSVLELVVKNGAKELKNLFTTLKNAILPPR